MEVSQKPTVALTHLVPLRSLERESKANFKDK